MDQARHARRPPEELARDARRNEAARKQRLRADARKGPSQNLEEGCALVKLGFEFSAGFAHAR